MGRRAVAHCELSWVLAAIGTKRGLELERDVLSSAARCCLHWKLERCRRIAHRRQWQQHNHAHHLWFVRRATVRFRQPTRPNIWRPTTNKRTHEPSQQRESRRTRRARQTVRCVCVCALPVSVLCCAVWVCVNGWRAGPPDPPHHHPRLGCPLP